MQDWLQAGRNRNAGLPKGVRETMAPCPAWLHPEELDFPLGNAWHNPLHGVAGGCLPHVAAEAIGLGSGHCTLPLF